MRDIGANLTNNAFSNDLDSVIFRARQAGVKHIDITGTSIQSSKDAIVITKKNQGYTSASAGIHPHNASTFTDNDLLELEKLIMEPTVLMHGEMGLDFARNISTPSSQEHAFLAQLSLTHDSKKPLFLHCRDAFERFTAIMDKQPTDTWNKSIVHCFTGTRTEAQAYLDRGAYIGITGWITDNRRNAQLVKALEIIPLERLLIETDAPYLTPRNNSNSNSNSKSKSKTRNEPAYLPHICVALSTIYGTTPDGIAEITQINADQLIGHYDHPNKPKI